MEPDYRDVAVAVVAVRGAQRPGREDRAGAFGVRLYGKPSKADGGDKAKKPAETTSGSASKSSDGGSSTAKAAEKSA